MSGDRKNLQEIRNESVLKDETTSQNAAQHMVETREQFIERALHEYESPLIGYANGFVHDLDRARDVVQDTFIRLCRQDVEKVRDGLKSWLFTVCRNRALDVLRKESRMKPMEEPVRERTAQMSSGPDQVTDQSERMTELMQYLDRLSENQKTVILMKFHDGFSYKEIEKLTGLSSGNIGFLIHTGVKRLREILPADIMEGMTS